MSQIYVFLYLSICLYGNILAEEITHEDVRTVTSIQNKEEIVYFNRPVQRERENLSWQGKLLEKLNAPDIQNVPITELQPAINSRKLKVLNTAIERNFKRQYISAVDLELPQINLDDEVEMDETIYLTFSEKDRSDDYETGWAVDRRYAVLITVKVRNESNEEVCSGSLLTSRWVLTAAHCFEIDVDEVTVYAGANSLYEIGEPQVQLQNSKDYYKHPKYSAATYQKLKYDIAMVKVDKAFKMGRRVNTIQLRKSEWTHDGYKACTLTGFGSVYSYKIDDYKRRGLDHERKTYNLEVKNKCPCLDRSRDGIVMCSRPREDYGLCVGDTGGGLICDGEVVAVASAVLMLEDIEKCVPLEVDCGRNNTFFVFEKTGPSLEWINSKLNKASTVCCGHQIVIGVVVFLSTLYLHQSFL